jgi:dTDP-4-amino-4,6-dideoxygalactose transaminase
MISLLGAKPVFVDVDRDTLMTDAGEHRGGDHPRTKAIIPVHYAGAAFDLDPLYALADKHGITVIEDAAHAAGARIAAAMSVPGAPRFFVPRHQEHDLCRRRDVRDRR